MIEIRRITTTTTVVKMLVRDQAKDKTTIRTPVQAATIKFQKQHS